AVLRGDGRVRGALQPRGDVPAVDARRVRRGDRAGDSAPRESAHPARTQRMSGRLFVVGLLLIGAALAVGAWWLRESPSAVTVDEIGDKVQTVRRGQLPVFATGGDVATLYRFAADHPEAFTGVQCTCGCVNFGHASNRACYIKTERGDERTFTSHAAT